jgi:predicted extracellular nuclease
MAGGTLAIATFNVKDLLEPQNAKERAHLDAKLAWLAEVVRTLDADVLALQEVGSANLVRTLAGRLPSGGGYGVPVVGTADARGIRCALLSRLPVLATHVHTAEWLEFPRFFATDPNPFGGRIPLRRGVVEVRLDAGFLGPIEVLVGHFKSKHSVPLRHEASALPAPAIAPAPAADVPVEGRARAEGELRSLVWRSAEALFVRGLVDAHLARGARVVVAGDFNDTADSVPVRAIRGTDLVSCGEKVPAAARFSVLHNGRPEAIDHILVSAPLAEHLTRARFLNESLREHAPFDAPDAAPAIDSDHAPLVAHFEEA